MASADVAVRLDSRADRTATGLQLNDGEQRVWHRVEVADGSTGSDSSPSLKPTAGRRMPARFDPRPPAPPALTSDRRSRRPPRARPGTRTRFRTRRLSRCPTTTRSGAPKPVVPHRSAPAATSSRVPPPFRTGPKPRRQPQRRHPPHRTHHPSSGRQRRSGRLHRRRRRHPQRRELPHPMRRLRTRVEPIQRAANGLHPSQTAPTPPSRLRRLLHRHRIRRLLHPRRHPRRSRHRRPHPRTGRGASIGMSRRPRRSPMKRA